MSSYKAGYRIELKAKDRLKKMGFTVIRSARSLTEADLVAIQPKKREIWLIQCKKQEAPKDPKKLAEKYGDLKKLEGTYVVKTYIYAKRRGRYQFIEV